MTTRTQLQTFLVAGALVAPSSLAFAQTSTTQQQQPRQAGQATTQTDRTQSQAGQQQQRQQSGQQQSNQRLERELIDMIRLANETEIQFSQWAQQQSDNPEIQGYAQQMVEAHRQVNQKLQQARQGGQASAGQQSQSDSQASAGQPGQTGGESQPGASASVGGTAGASASAGGMSGSAEAQPGQPNPNLATDRLTRSDLNDFAQQREEVIEDRTAEASASAGSQGAQRGAGSEVYGMAAGEQGQDPSGVRQQLSQIHQQLADKRVESMRQYLGDKQGSEFNKAFLGCQILAHQEMLDKLQVVQPHVSSQTRDVLRQAEQTTQAHLKEAQDLMQKLGQS